MTQTVYLALAGQKQGDIKGSVTQRGFENLILVTAVHHELVSPRDPASGLPTGKRLHKPLTITKQLDRSSPLLYRALVTNENMTRFELKFWTQPPALPSDAPMHLDYLIRLTNASIADIAFSLLDTTDPAQARMPAFEEVSFTYQKIEWVWSDGGLMAADSWGA